MTAARLVVASFPAWLVTLGLFSLMQGLVTVEATIEDEVPDVTGIEIVKVMLQKKLKATEPKIKRPRVDPAPPPVPEAPSKATGKSGIGVIELTQVVVDPDPGGEEGQKNLAVAADGGAVPLVQVPPQYPVRAMQQRREGRVLVGFTITKAGGVRDARVLAAEPEGLFEDSALKAIVQWRYSPKVENGRPVEQNDMKTTITFRLDPARS